jgi:hypothetical protein
MDTLTKTKAVFTAIVGVLASWFASLYNALFTSLLCDNYACSRSSR